MCGQVNEDVVLTHSGKHAKVMNIYSLPNRKIGFLLGRAERFQQEAC